MSNKINAAVNAAKQALLDSGVAAVAIIALDGNGDLYTTSAIHPSVNKLPPDQKVGWTRQLANYVASYATHIK